MLDTYWSDHCRHTTFSTELKEVVFDDGYYRAPMEQTYQDYLDTHKNIYAGRDDKFVCLMDIALMAMKRLKKEGKLADQEESDEINACSIVVPIEVDGVTEEWLVNFKNETHNHPTEIEPFGGAATCLGGAIRDPLYRAHLCLSGNARDGRGRPDRRRCRIRSRASCRRRSWCARQRTVTAPTATRSDLRPDMSRRFTTRTMWRSAWRSERCWALRRAVPCRG